MLQISVPSLSFCFVHHTFSCNLLFNFLLQKNQTYKWVERKVSHGLITKLHLYTKLFWSKSQTLYHFIPYFDFYIAGRPLNLDGSESQDHSAGSENPVPATVSPVLPSLYLMMIYLFTSTWIFLSLSSTWERRLGLSVHGCTASF